MGNTVPQQSSFDLCESDDLNNFLSYINMIDSFHMNTSLSISSKCLAIINKLTKTTKDDSIKLISGLKLRQDDNLINQIEKLKFHCSLIRHLAVVNSSKESVKEWVQLDIVRHLISLTLDHIPIKYVQDMKLHRQTLIKLSLHNSIDNLESVINLCGADHSFSDKWIHLEHLDVRDNHLKAIDDSVLLLTSLTMLDMSRNEIDDLSFIQKIPTLVCLNASFNIVKSLPNVTTTRLRMLILAYNHLDSLKGVEGFKYLSTLNVSFNMIATNENLQQLKKMDFLTDLILRGNPLSHSPNYRKLVLDIVSPRVSVKFALDGKILTKSESAYLHKSDVIFIPPPSTLTTDISEHVPVITVDIGKPHCEPFICDSQSNSTNRTGRNINPVIIGHLSLSRTRLTIASNVFERSRHRFRHRQEKKIDSLSASEKTDIDSFSLINSVIHPSNIDSVNRTLESSNHNPNYIGEKTSNLFIACADKTHRAFPRVSIQIFEHKLMAVNEFDMTVDNTDLWMLMVATNDTLNEMSDAGNIIKLIFFVSSKNDDNEQFMLSTRTIEFAEALELKRFLYQLNLYLHHFSICYHDWTILPLTNMTLSCTKCNSKVTFMNNNPRPYRCKKCSGTSFLLRSTLSRSLDDVNTQSLKESKTQKMNFIKKRTMTGLSKQHSKPPTSIFLIRTFGSSECLTKENVDNPSMHSENETNQYSVEEYNESLKLVSNSAIIVKPEDGNLLNLDDGLNSGAVNMDQSMSAHECLEDNPAYALLKSSLLTPWVVHESLYGISMYMHDSENIDGRIKLYFLTKVMQDHEDLLFVFKVYFVYRSTGKAIASLFVISDRRVLVYSLVDIESGNFEECIKFVCEFPLQTLQQVEYCLHNQWIELQFKGKPIVTLLVGDIECVKLIGSSIADAVSKKTCNFSVVFSKAIAKLKSPLILSAMTNEVYDGVSMQTLSNGESYLIRSSTLLPSNETSSLEYDPKLIVIESKHIFFVTFNYSAKSHLPSFELSRTLLLLNVMDKMIIDTRDDCLIHLIVIENKEERFVDLRFMSPHSRLKAAFCIGKMWKALFDMDISFITEDSYVD